MAGCAIYTKREKQIDSDQSFLFKVGVIVLAIIILGCAYIWYIQVTDNDPNTHPPDVVLVVLGSAIPTLASMVLGKTNQRLANGLQQLTVDNNSQLTTALRNQKQQSEKIEGAKETAESVRERQEQIIEKLNEMERNRERAREERR